jgi:hypothetical protein
MKVLIKSVKIVSGSTLNSRWKYPMQVIRTDSDEVFIENTVEHAHAHWKPVDYTNYIGSTLDVRVVDSMGYRWIRRVT